MLPTYMNSSQQGHMRPQEHYYHHHQGFENNNPHHMTTMDAPCGYWPTPTPSPCYGNFPPYNNTYWPPCYPPQVPYHHPCCVNHSSFHPQVPPCYSHQPFPVYESAKDVPGKEQHCAKCSPYPKSNRGVVIEEHEPEIDKGEQSVRSSNFPYPIIWMPHENARIQENGSGSHEEVQTPENMKVQKCDPKSWNGCFQLDESALKYLMQNHQDRNKMQNGRTVEFPFDVSKLKSLLQGQDPKIQEHASGRRDQPPAEVKASDNMKIQKSDPRYLNGYFPFDESTLKSLLQNQARKSVEPPFDINKLKSSLQGQDGKEVQSQKNKEEQEQLPYPVFWIPSHGKRKDIESSESNLKSFSSKNSNEGQVSQYKGNEGNSECNALSDAKENHQDRRKMQNENTMELPFDINNKLKSLLQGQDGKEVQSQMNKEEQEQLPYPIFWIPSHGKGGSVEATESEERTNEGKEGNSRCNVLPEAEEKSSMRTIPVESHLQEPRNIPVKLLEKQLQKPTEETKKITKGEPVENTKKKQSSSLSSPKASRLPPVCLRVDPLPKKKTGGSKSLNSPRRKEQEETKVASSSRKAESKTIPEACNINSKEANKEMKESAESNSNLQEGANSTKEITEKSVKKTFTDEEAARIIQSRYRGYDVRRWEPLKKLKEIATVREQMGDVEKRVQALEASSTDKYIEEKEIIVMEETVMNLLLKLDSVQGLHRSIRDYRKSLARELSDIEDKLDSLKKSNTMTKEEAVREQVEIISQSSDYGVNVEQSQLEEEENKMVSDSKDRESVLLPSLEEGHSKSVMNRSEEQLMAEGEEETGLSETLATDLEPVKYETVPEKIGETETVLPNPMIAVGDGMSVENTEEDKAMEEPLRKYPQVVENATEISETESHASETEVMKEDKAAGVEEPLCESSQVVENASEVSESALENEDRKGDDETILPSVTDPEEYKAVEETVRELPSQVVENSTEVSETESQALENEVIKEDIAMISGTESHGSENEVIEEDKAVVESLEEEPLRELSQVVENSTEVSETEAIASEKEDDEIVLSSEKDVELPVGVIDDEAPLLSQDASSSCTREAEKTAMESETASQEENKIETSEAEKTEESQDLHEIATVESETASQEEETDIKTQTEHQQDSSLACTSEAETTATDSETLSQEVTKTSKAQEEEKKRLMEENQRFKETMETLMKAGREQLQVISKLTTRVESLEKKLSSQKKTKKRRTQIGRTKPMSVSSTDAVKETKYVV